MKKILQTLTSRVFIIVVLILIQAAILIGIILKLSNQFLYFYGGFLLLSIIIVVYLVGRDMNPSSKIPWVIMIMLFPIFGGLFYLMFGNIWLPEKYESIMRNLAFQFRLENNSALKKLTKENLRISRQCEYIKNVSGMYPFEHTTASYFSPGEKLFDVLLEELEKAEHFIFMEYFIIQEGKMWDSILEILKRKASEGLDVRLLYDDIGCINTLPYRYFEKIQRFGIKCAVFNPFKPTLSILFNNRDHRKITVIDGHTGFTGGINLADEYINELERFGHWKDCGVIIHGDAVINLTLMFLENWNFYEPTDTNFDKFLPHHFHPSSFKTDGYVQPYMDSPLDGELLGETVYMNMINHAANYIYINTPYLIVDNEMITSLACAAKRGIDVRIVTPHIPDKWYVHLITQASYPQLIKSGVKIYEYTPGFIHSKTCLVDDTLAAIGTINFDYRSLYHHYECGCLFYQNHVCQQLKEDYLNTLKICTPITYEMSQNVSLLKRLLRSIIRIFAPLM